MKDLNENEAYVKLFGDFISGKRFMTHQTPDELAERIRVSTLLTPAERRVLNSNLDYIYEAGWNYTNLGPAY